MFSSADLFLNVIIAITSTIVVYYCIKIGRLGGFSTLWKYIAVGFGLITLSRLVYLPVDVGLIGSDYDIISHFLVFIGILFQMHGLIRLYHVFKGER